MRNDSLRGRLSSRDWKSQPPRERSRGQLILIGVITMGFLLISMTLVMNGFLYSQNIESEGIPAEVGEITDLQQIVATEYGTLLINTNEYDATPRENYSHAATAAGLAIRDHASVTRGQLVDISLHRQTNGTLLRQTGLRDFTDVDGTRWNVSTSEVRRFQLAVNQTGDLHRVDAINRSELSDAFHITVEDDLDASWTLYIANDTGETIVAVDKDETGPSERYRSTAESLTVDVTTGSVNEDGSRTVDETALYADGFALNLTEGARTISIHNPERARGGYALVMPGTPEFGTDSFNDAHNSPYMKPIAYNATFNVTYESAAHYYAGQVHVAPCRQTASHCLSYIRTTEGPP